MLNKAILMGRLTRDPELRRTANNISVISFTIAVERDYAPQGEQRVTDFIDIVAWRKTAEFISRYFTKGMLVAVSGSLQSRKWEDKEGNKRVSYEVVADDVYFAESKRSSNSSDSRSEPALPFDSDMGGMDGAGAFSELSDLDGELPF